MALASLSKNISAINKIAQTQPQVLQAIQQAASKTGVDFAYLVQKAGVESSFNPKAQAKTSSASGLYQFVRGTWLEMIEKHGANYGLANEAAAIERGANGRLTVKNAAERERILALRNNPHLAAAMAAELAAENTETLRARGIDKIGATEMYMAHFLGSDGAADFLQTLEARPNMPAAALLPQAAAANRAVFYTDGGRARTVTEVYNNFAAKFKDANVEMAQVPAPAASKPVAMVPPLAAEASALVSEAPAAAATAMPPLQILAVITNENENAAELKMAAGPTTAALNNVSLQVVSAMTGLVASDNLFRAMQIAEQMLESSQNLRETERPRV